MFFQTLSYSKIVKTLEELNASLAKRVLLEKS